VQKGKTPLSTLLNSIESLEDDSTRGLYERRLYKKITRNHIRGEDDVELTWKKLKAM